LLSGQIQQMTLSISTQLERTGGKSSGFDYMRLILAISVICFHSIVLCYGAEFQKRLVDSPFGIIVGAIVPMFFSLSGFLVAGSLERSKSIAIFLGLRGLRIFPALAVDTLFCALILGPVLTILPLSQYLTEPDFFAYFLNIPGFIHYHLPGVFDSNPNHEVNGQLWTIPSELQCYLTLTVLALVGAHRRRWVFLILMLVSTALLEARLLQSGGHAWRGIVMCFLYGVIFHIYRDCIALNRSLFALAVLASAIFIAKPGLGYLLPISVTYVTVYLGLKNPKRFKFLEGSDYSYGLYLYGFPLQQMLVSTVPFAREWYGNLLLGLPLALAFSMISWHLLEKRALAKRHILYALDDWWSAGPLARMKAVLSRLRKS
jgi:peptidoglycan/LPS O-acetylase OafA/YrhL